MLCKAKAYITYLALLFGLFLAADGKVIGAAVIPHGDFAYDPSLVHFQNGSREIHDSAVEVGKLLQAANPDIILWSTPHGLALNNDFAFYGNTNGSGFAMLGEDLHDPDFPLYKVSLNATLSPNHTSDLISLLLSKGMNASSLMGWADSEPMPLRWGEVIPLTFIGDLALRAQNIIVSQPTRRYSQSVAMIPELLSLGAELHAFLEHLSERVVVVISADLAHTHLASGPYGYSPDAEIVTEHETNRSSGLLFSDETRHR